MCQIVRNTTLQRKKRCNNKSVKNGYNAWLSILCNLNKTLENTNIRCSDGCFHFSECYSVAIIYEKYSKPFHVSYSCLHFPRKRISCNFSLIWELKAVPLRAVFTNSEIFHGRRLVCPVKCG